MLSSFYPDQIHAWLDYPAGLRALPVRAGAMPVLLFKGSKEALLAAQLRGGFHVYGFTVELHEGATLGLVTAVFDDHDEPLVLRTPLVDEAESRELIAVLQANAIRVYGFDEFNREAWAFRASVGASPLARRTLAEISLVPFSFPNARAADDQLKRAFGNRTAADDESAIRIAFLEALAPAPPHDGEPAPRFVTLKRASAGATQEPELRDLLGRLIAVDNLWLNPVVIATEKEWTDLAVVTERDLIVLQAKDNPNNEAILAQSIDRKRANARKQLAKGLKQSAGALRRLKQGPMELRVADQVRTVELGARKPWLLVVVKELFDDDYAHYSQLLFEVAERAEARCVALDFREVHDFTARLASAEDLFAALERIVTEAYRLGEYPRLRVGFLGDDASNLQG